MKALYKYEEDFGYGSLVSIFSMDTEDFEAWQELEETLNGGGVDMDIYVCEMLGKYTEYEIIHIPSATTLITKDPEVVKSIENKIKTDLCIVDYEVSSEAIQAMHDAGVDVDPECEYTIEEIAHIWREYKHEK